MEKRTEEETEKSQEQPEDDEAQQERALAEALQEAKKAGLQTVVRRLDRERPLKDLALFNAATMGHVRCTQLLIEAGADVNWTGSASRLQERRRCTTLVETAGNGQLETQQLLLEAGALVDIIGHHGPYEVFVRGISATLPKWCEFAYSEMCTALESAVIGGHVACVQKLVEWGADVNRRNGLNLRLAAATGNVSMLSALQSAGADVKGYGSELLWQSLFLGRSESLQWFINQGVDVNISCHYESKTVTGRCGEKQL